MPKLKAGTIDTTSEEEKAIQVGIAADPDTLGLDDEWFERARPVSEEHPEIVERARRRRFERGMATNEQVSIPIDADLAAHFRSTGPGWRTRLNDTLRQAVFGRQD